MSQPLYIPAADFALPFDMPRAGVRGRLVRLEAASARALSAHELPEAAARVTGETLALAAILGSALKLDGRLTVQTKSDGALDLVTADYYGPQEGRDRGLRGFARIDERRFTALAGKSFAELAGAGVLAITIEPRLGDKAYQGIVELSPDGIAASAQTYFAQSEQLPTRLRLAAAPLYVAGSREPQWRAGALMLQATPDTTRNEEDWERLCSHLKTVEDLELVDVSLGAETLLWR
ncbi:MAG TPA: Hsp33 family molecular chaperone HslO, partial [Rhizomicrobium sp.]